MPAHLEQSTAVGQHSGEPRAEASIEERLRAAQIELVYRQGVPIFVGGILSLLFAAYILRNTATLPNLGAWLSVSLLVYGVRLLLVRAYLHAAPVEQAKPHWIGRYRLGTVLSGVLWGMAGLLLPEGSIAYQAFLIVGLTSLGAASVVSHAALPGMPQSFIVPLLAPFGLYQIATGTDIEAVMGIMMLLAMLVQTILAMTTQRTIERNLRLGLENEALVRTLRQSKDEAEDLNRDLREEIEERHHAEQRIHASRQELSRILDNMQDMYFRTDLNGVVLKVSPSARELLGYTPEEIVGLNAAQMFDDGDGLAKFMSALERTSGSVFGYEAHMRRKDGRVIWVSKNAQYYLDDSGAVAGVEGTSRDITRLKRIQAELNAEKERALVTLASIADGVIATDAEGRVDYINPVAEILTGWKAIAALGRPLAEIFHVIDEDTRQLADDPVRVCLRTRRPYRLPGHPILLAAGDAVEYSVEVHVAPIFDEAAQVTGTALVVHDVTELRGLAREMSYQASHDMLTGLVNRREFELRVESAVQISRREGISHAMCYLDLDQFKVVNDTCGHIAGDELIKQIATLLRGRLRESDILARLGGDEFGVLLEGCPLNKAQEIADELRNIVHRHRFDWEGRRFEIGVSIGVVAITPESGGLAEVLTFADSACYVAKDQGRNRVHVFDPEDSALVEHHSHMRWVQRLQRALEEDRFELHYQRVDALKEGDTLWHYHEILLRMRDEAEGLIGPGVFIPAAERYHLMPAVDRWVVRHALRALARRKQWDRRDVFSVNLSGQSLGDEAFLEFVQVEIDAAGIAPQHVCFEVTETAAVANLRSAQHFIHTLRRRGCVFALDDFGSGLSSFAYLKRLPVDFLKIDGRFVKDMLNDSMDHAMVESINQLGHVVGVQTIAEFVENDAIAAALKQLGVDYAQGYGIHKPEPLDNLIP
ncbi:MAG: EAL domain-containing protein [Gammaproteobacteria bacterium]|nr:EAL domain-containing protein [Gammaproteobacteria bacterium]